MFKVTSGEITAPQSSALRSLLAFLMFVFAFMLISEHSFAAGKKRKKEPKDAQAYPTRNISIGDFVQANFMLPDGKTRIDSNTYLPEMMVVEMAQTTPKLRPRQPGSGDGGETQDRFVLRGGITAFEASNTEFGVKFGYKPGQGDVGNGKVPDLSADVKFHVGILDMDFHIFDTQRQEVVAVGHGSAHPSGVAFDVTLNFSEMETGADFVFNSPMTKHFRAAMRRAITQMASDPKTNFFMDWQSVVSNVNLDLKQIFFNAGLRDDLKVGDVFTVYDLNEMRLGEVKVKTVEFEKSSATYKSDSNDEALKSTREGGLVKIYFKEMPR